MSCRGEAAAVSAVQSCLRSHDSGQSLLDKQFSNWQTGHCSIWGTAHFVFDVVLSKSLQFDKK